MAAEEKILVVGGSGIIGRSLADHLAQSGRSVVRTTRKREPGWLTFDLSGDRFSENDLSGITVAYICAGVTALEQCRKYPAETRAVNVVGTLRLVDMLVSRGVFVVFLSSNLVFDGSSPHMSPDAQTNPLTEYGRQKAEAERQLLQYGGRCCVARLTKVLGPGNSLLCGWRDAMLRGVSVRPFCDMVMAPVSLDFAVRAVALIGLRRDAGIIQVSARQDVTYEQAARHLATRLDLPGDVISPLHVADSGLAPESVPAHTTLDTSRLSSDYGMSAPQPWTAIERAIGR